MGRSPCCEKEHTNKGAWTKEEDERLINYIKAHGEGCWRSLPKAAGKGLSIVCVCEYLCIFPIIGPSGLAKLFQRMNCETKSILVKLSTS